MHFKTEKIKCVREIEAYAVIPTEMVVIVRMRVQITQV